MMTFNIQADKELINLNHKELFFIRLIPLGLEKTEMMAILGFSICDWIAIERSIFNKLGVSNWNKAILKCFAFNILNKNQFTDPISKQLSTKYAEVTYNKDRKEAKENGLDDIIALYFYEVNRVASIKYCDANFKEIVTKSQSYFEVFNAFKGHIRNTKIYDGSNFNDCSKFILEANTSIKKLITIERTSKKVVLDLIGMYLRRAYNSWDFSNISTYYKNFKHININNLRCAV